MRDASAYLSIESVQIRSDPFRSVHRGSSWFIDARQHAHAKRLKFYKYRFYRSVNVDRGIVKEHNNYCEPVLRREEAQPFVFYIVILRKGAAHAGDAAKGSLTVREHPFQPHRIM